MTRFLGMLVLCLLLSGTVSPQPKTDLERERFRESVHLVTAESSESIHLEGREEKGRNKKLDSLTFDSQGHLIERVIYDDYGFLVGRERYSHDVAGRLITAGLYDSKGRRQEKRSFIYQQNHLQEILTYGGTGQATLRQVNIYDRKGRLQDEVYYDPTNVIGKTSYKTDERGNAIAAAFFQPNGSKAVAPLGPCFSVHEVTYSYDSRGRVTAETAFEVDGSVKRNASYRYNDEEDHIFLSAGLFGVIQKRILREASSEHALHFLQGRKDAN